MGLRGLWWLGALAAMAGGGAALCQTTTPGRAAASAPATMRAMDLNALRKSYSDQMMASLGVTENQWNAMEPRVKEIQSLRAALRSGPAAFGGGGAMIFAASVEHSDSVKEMLKALTKATAELGKVLQESGEGNAEAIKFALKDYREARSAVQGEVDRLQGELKRSLSPRQEAVLKQMGVVE